MHKFVYNLQFQIQLLKEGPNQLAQAWILGAMHQDYKRMKGIKEEDTENRGQLQSSLKEFFDKTKDQGI